MSNRVINLSKNDSGRVINLKKETSLLSNEISIKLRWDMNRESRSKEDDFDLDVSLLPVKKTTSSGDLGHGDGFVYYNEAFHQFVTKEGDVCVQHSGDDRTGQRDFEEIKVYLDKVPNFIDELVVAVTIDEAKEKGQDFGMMYNSSITVSDDNTGNDLIHYSLESKNSHQIGIVFCKFVRSSEGWVFDTKTEDLPDGLASLLTKYKVKFNA